MGTILYFFWDGFSQQTAAAAPDAPSLDSRFSIARTIDREIEV